MCIRDRDISFAENTAGWMGFINNNTFSGFYSKNEMLSVEDKESEFGNIIEVYRSI